MDLYRFLLGIVFGLCIGFSRLNQLRFIARDPILMGILLVTRLPVQSTFWRFVNAWHRNVARQVLRFFADYAPKRGPCGAACSELLRGRRGYGYAPKSCRTN